MKTVRYKISQEGIEAIYNYAPEVTAIDIEHKIAEDDDLNRALTITDDRDSKEYIEVEFSEYDNYEVGTNVITATVRDSWGLETTVNFNVYVLSYLDNNTVTLKSSTNQELVTIGFDSKTGKLMVQYHDENDGVPILSDSSNSNVIKLNIYDENQNKLGYIPFKGNDTVSSIKTMLTLFGFVNYSYHYNYYIGIEIIDESAISLVKITNVEKDSEQLDSVDYETGVTNVDYFENVRFELNPYGLTAIYNEAPIIINNKGDVEAVKSLDVSDYNLLDSIEVNDDKDKLTTDDITIQYNGEDDSSSLTLGNNVITLTIKDNWGRQSTPLQFNLVLRSAMDDMSIDFLYATSGLIPDLNTKAMTLTFDMDQGKILVNKLSDQFKFNHIQYGSFGVYDKEDNLIFKAILGQNNNYETDDYSSATKYRYVADFKTALENVTGIEYGYKIKIKMYQAPFLYINGEVINAQEDYSEGAYLGEMLNTSTFTITEEGLVQDYTKPESEANNNDIVWLSGVDGGKSFDINVNPETQTLTVSKFTNEPLDTLYSKNTSLFSIAVYDAEGNFSYGIDTNPRSYASDVVTALNGKSFEFGGYMTIKIYPTDRNRIRNMRIYGDIAKSSRLLDDVDYSEEIKDVAYFNEARFYFNETGLSLFYNYAPEFTGLDDIILLQGETEGVDLRENVNVFDDNTENLEYTIQDADGNEITNTESYLPPGLGAYEVYYVATDSLGRVAREPRFVWLQSASSINLNSESLLTVQEATPNLQTDEEIMNYLINLVTVSDEEDDANGKHIVITKDNISGTFDTNTPGEYPITYTVQDSDGNITKQTFTINVVRTISVTVPTYIPFQIVTNLIEDSDTSSLDEFIAGVMNVSNNYLTNVDVYLKSFTKENDSGDLEIVSPTTFSNWDELSEEDTMRYMALGMYNKSNFESSIYTKDSPLWLNNNTTDIYLGRLSKATNLDTPNVGQLSFVSKHGTNFIGGTSKARFSLVLEFR